MNLDPNKKQQNLEAQNAKRDSATFSNNTQDAAKNKSNFIEIPSISLPKGGGAIKAIDEKFEVNAATGTATFSIPIALTPGRNGFNPAIALQYDSGRGNGPFGLGWAIDIPSISRKTEKRIPLYQDEDASDVFVLSDAEDLVPLLELLPGGWKKYLREESENNISYEVTRYRPRVEGSFARIEKWKNKMTDDVHWRSVTRDNVHSYYGLSPESKISDPDNPSRIFSWLLCRTHDDKGNVIIYGYKKEDFVGIPAKLSEKNRINRSAQVYLKAIFYGNKTPFYYGNPLPSDDDFVFRVIMDFGEHEDQIDLKADIHQEKNDWSYRKDSFSNCKAGFEIRTYRRCNRILIFHCFDAPADLPINPYLVRSLKLFYDDAAILQGNQNSVEGFSFLVKAKQNSHQWDGVAGHYITKNLPDLEFSYQQHEWNTEVIHVSTENAKHAPIGINDKQYLWIDLYSEGITGILTEQASGWFYKFNLGDGKFSPAKVVSPKPSFGGISERSLVVQDLEGNGIKYLAQYEKDPKGFFKLTEESEWGSFKPFENIPVSALKNPFKKFIDLDGDGVTDLLTNDEQSLRWYRAAGEKGFEVSKTIAREFDEEKGPAILFEDTEQSIFLADMNGDGLTDIVRIRNGEVCYWPNMGYGRFGARQIMENSPKFCYSNLFNPSYVRLADIDGSGITDLIYLDHEEIRVWMNLNGNGFTSSPEIIIGFPAYNSVTDISVCDFLGTGTTCLVFSSPLVIHSQQPLKYMNLMGGKKPHLLKTIKNNCGKTISLEYKSSTHFYLEDKRNGKPWITRLPFPVHVLTRKELHENVSQLRFVSSYTYHHGYYDAVEKEFRGFGRVDQLDTETYEYFKRESVNNIVQEDLHQPPILTKTWFHTGAYFNREKIISYFKNENEDHEEFFINKQFTEYHLPEAVITDQKGVKLKNAETRVYREAARACKSLILRQEVYAMDETDKQKLPYSVAEHNCNIRLLQPHEANPYAVFMVTESEAITYNYERILDDPRISHNINYKLDEFGNIIQGFSIVYGRNITDSSLPDEVKSEQEGIRLMLTENKYTEDLNTTVDYRLRALAESAIYEVNELLPSKKYYNLEDFNTMLPTAIRIDYDESFTAGMVQMRLTEKQRLIYANDNSGTPLPFQKIQPKGLVYEKYTLAYNKELIMRLYANNVNDGLLLDAGYKSSVSLKASGVFPHSDPDNEWWGSSGTVSYPANPSQHFFIPDKYIDPFGNASKVFYEPKYQLHIQGTENSLQDVISVGRFDYRIMAPIEIKDGNDNLTEVVFDTLGLLAGIALKGKGNDADNLVGFIPDLTQAQLDQFINDPFSNGAELLQHASTRFVYDLHRQPIVAATITRETHHSSAQLSGIASPLQYTFEYTSGLGKMIMNKIQADPGEASFIDVDNVKKTIQANPRWIGNGRTIYNNKGNPVKQYEPYFSTNHQFENDSRLVDIGVTPVLYYDPLSRNIRTNRPDGTFTKVEFDTWQQKTFDANDTVKDSSWFTTRVTGNLSSINTEKTAAEKSAVHFDTPSIAVLDNLGRTIYSIAENAFIDPVTHVLTKEKYGVFIKSDIKGNPIFFRDPRNNKVMEYDYDILGRKATQLSMDAGKLWFFNDVLDKPHRSWNSRGFSFRYEYDALHRPVKVFMKEVNLTEKNIVRTVYGKNTMAEKQKNLCGQTVEQYDSAGFVKNLAFDFKGNLLSTEKRILKNYKDLVNWDTVNIISDIEDTVFTTTTIYDAINRGFQIQLPDTSIIHLTYSKTGLLKELHVQVRGDANKRSFVKNISYNEKLQRLSVLYGNNLITKYTYDKNTRALIKILTTGNNGADVLQEHYYTYDAVGNITQLEDKAQQTHFFNNAVVNPISTYTYDALYRLIEANGREHIGQQNQPEDNWNDFPRTNLNHRQDGNAMRAYVQQYQYDEVGNIIQLKHIANGGSYTRDYEYESNNNRLKSTKVGSATLNYSHNEHGCFISMPHLSQMEWNYKEEFYHANLGGGGHAYYVYDLDGERMRKVIELPGGKKKEIIYLGATEIYRESTNNTVTLQRETLHVIDDTSRIAMIETKTVDTNDGTGIDEPLTRYQFSSHLGSSTLELDGAAEIISYEEYHPYGTTAYQAVNKNIKLAAKRYRYTGKERDEESGLYYHGSRFYSPWLARWIAADPIGIEDGINLYAYVGSNPIMKSDPTGKNGLKQVGNPAGKYEHKRIISNKEYESADCTSNSYVYNETHMVCIYLSNKPPVQIAPAAPIKAPPKAKPKPKQEPKTQTSQSDPNFQVKVIKVGLYQEVILGEAYEGPRTILGTVLGIGLSFIPFVDTAFDARDIAATKEKMDKDPSGENKVSFGISVVGAIPEIGSLITAGRKAWKGRKAATKVMKAADAAEDVLEGFEKLDDFKKGLKAGDATADLSKSTFARLTVEGTEVFGNAVSTAGRSKEDLEMMRKLLKESFGKTTTKAAIEHAEADALLEAYSKGLKAEKAVMHVDRDLCGFCYSSLKNILPLLGIKELTIYARQGDYLIQYTIKAVTK